MPRKSARTARRGGRARPARTGASPAKAVFARDWARRTKILKRIARKTPDKLTVDDVHDLRVTTRRLRASLSVLRRCMTVPAAQDARADLRSLGKTLGRRRMLDVALIDARHYGADTAALEKRIARTRSSLRTALKPKRTGRLIRRLERVERAIPGASFERLSPWLQNIEWELAYRLIQPPDTPEGRHQLRIQIKKARYLIESLGHRSRTLQKLQDHLGREHDLDVLQTLVGRVPRATKDHRRARSGANRVMAPALRSALRTLRTIRRDLVP